MYDTLGVKQTVTVPLSRISKEFSMKQRHILLLAGTTLLVLCFCRGAKKTDIAKVGTTTLAQSDLDAFNNLVRYFPQEQGEFALLSRNAASALVETEAIFQKHRWDLSNLAIIKKPDWVWKTRYFTSINYTTDVLQNNLGFPDAQLKRYYEANKNQFQGTEKYDSTGKARSTKVPRPFLEAKGDVAKKLFIGTYKPDPNVYKGAKTAADSGEALTKWVNYIRERGHSEFFLKLFYKEKTGRPYPDSLKDLYGKNNYLTPADMDIILSWVPVDRREQARNNESALMEYAGWLARWKLFSEKAKKTGFAAEPLTHNLLKWAWKIEVAQRYVNKNIGPMAGKNISIDTGMARYSYWDENGYAGQSIDSAVFKSHLATIAKQKAAVNFDGHMYKIRKSKHVRFLQAGGVSDERSRDPAKLLRQADALRDTGKTTEAQALFQALVTDFAFAKEGKNALLELAKIQTEQQAYIEAIRNYRRFLITGADKSKQYSSMFMIGFIYDEYLDRPEMAELNYRWVLKNAPLSELADDAEFMMLHLGEPMASADELQAETRRQGKKVEASEEDGQKE